MEVMNLTAKTSNAKTEHSNVNLVIVLPHTSVAMVIEIVETCPMKLDVLQNILVDVTALKQDSNVTTTSACSILMFAMVQMIAEVTDSNLFSLRIKF